MKFKELRNKIDDLYIDLRFDLGGRINEFNTQSEKYDEFDVMNIVSKDRERLTVYLKWENKQ